MSYRDQIVKTIRFNMTGKSSKVIKFMVTFRGEAENNE